MRSIRMTKECRVRVDNKLFFDRYQYNVNELPMQDFHALIDKKH